ncbi:hypothetical protein HYT25_00625 [Candidatus Pacearchaeota archaeon]|nr:hypothetical protein [Candidatus Pacearchaeota archaeon]
MKTLTALTAGLAAFASSLFVSDVQAENKFHLPDFEKLKPSFEQRIGPREFLNTGSGYILIDGPILFRFFHEKGFKRYAVTTIDCEVNGKKERYDIFIRDMKTKRVIQRKDYNIFNKLEEVPYDTMLDMSRALCPAGKLI